MLRNSNLGRVASVRRWTQTATDCYKRNCICQGCFYYDFFKESPQRCQMKATVLELVRTLGAPDMEHASKQYIDEDEEIITAS